jgi:hypothetical protein
VGWMIIIRIGVKHVQTVCRKKGQQDSVYTRIRGRVTEESMSTERRVKSLVLNSILIELDSMSQFPTCTWPLI